MSNTPNTGLKYSLIASLSMGLAPFFPEPHIVGKIKWLFGDPGSMNMMDWFDLFLHGTPWMFLIYFAVKKLRNSF